MALSGEELQKRINERYSAKGANPRLPEWQTWFTRPPDVRRPTNMLLSWEDPEAERYPDVMKTFSKWKEETWKLAAPGEQEFNPKTGRYEDTKRTRKADALVELQEKFFQERIAQGGIPIPSGGGFKLITPLDDEGNIIGQQGLEERGLLFNEAVGKLSKRLSRFFQPHVAQGVFNLSRLGDKGFLEFGGQFGEETASEVPTARYDAMGYVAREMVDKVFKNSPTELQEKYAKINRLQVTIQRQNPESKLFEQIKSHVLVLPQSEMPGQALMAFQEGAGKPEFGWDLSKTSKKWKPTDTYLAVDVGYNIHANPDVDIQSFVNIYRKLFTNQQIKGWMDLGYEKRFRSLETGKSEEAIRDMFSDVDTPEQQLSRESFALFEYVKKGGKITDSAEMISFWTDQMLSKQYKQSERRLAIPIPGTFTGEMSDALTSPDPMIRDLKKGQSYVDFERGTIFINRYDYEESYRDRKTTAPEILSGGDQDDQLLGIANKNMEGVLNRRPIGLGEFITTKFTNTLKEFQAHGIYPTDADFSVLESIRNVEDTQFPKDNPGGILPKPEPYPANKIKKGKFSIADWAAFTLHNIYPNMYTLEKVVNVSMAEQLTLGTETEPRPARLSNVIDAQQKDFGTPMDKVREWAREAARNLAKYPLTWMAASRAGIKEYTPPEPGQEGYEFQDIQQYAWELEIRTRNRAAGLMQKASMPLEVVKQANPEGNLGRLLTGRWQDAFEKGREGKDYTAANVAAIAALDELKPEEQDQAILQAMTSDWSAESGSNAPVAGRKRWLWSKDMMPRTMGALGRAGYLTQGSSSTKERPALERPTEMINVVAQNAEKYDLANIPAERARAWLLGSTIRFEQSEKGQQIYDEKGHHISDVSSVMAGGTKDLVSGRVSKVSFYENQLVLGLTNPRYNDRFRDPAYEKLTPEELAQTMEDVDVVAGMALDGQYDVSQLPVAYQRAVAKRMEDIANPPALEERPQEPPGHLKMSQFGYDESEFKSASMPVEKERILQQGAIATWNREFSGKSYYKEMADEATGELEPRGRAWWNKVRTTKETAETRVGSAAGLSRYATEDPNVFRIPLPNPVVNKAIKGGLEWLPSKTNYAEVNLATGKADLAGINISSGSDDPFAAALTNPTELAFKKGKIKGHYPVTMGEVTYPDAEAAWQALKPPLTEPSEKRTGVMTDILEQKLRQNPQLEAEITNRGGVPFLERSSHLLKGKNWWEGRGTESPFISSLVAGYKRLRAEAPSYHEVSSYQRGDATPVEGHGRFRAEAPGENPRAIGILNTLFGGKEVNRIAFYDPVANMGAVNEEFRFPKMKSKDDVWAASGASVKAAVRHETGHAIYRNIDQGQEMNWHLAVVDRFNESKKSGKNMSEGFITPFEYYDIPEDIGGPANKEFETLKSEEFAHQYSLNKGHPHLQKRMYPNFYEYFEGADIRETVHEVLKKPPKMWGVSSTGIRRLKAEAPQGSNYDVRVSMPFALQNIPEGWSQARQPGHPELTSPNQYMAPRSSVTRQAAVRAGMDLFEGIVDPDTGKVREGALRHQDNNPLIKFALEFFGGGKSKQAELNQWVDTLDVENRKWLDATIAPFYAEQSMLAAEGQIGQSYWSQLHKKWSAKLGLPAHRQDYNTVSGSYNDVMRRRAAGQPPQQPPPPPPVDFPASEEGPGGESYGGEQSFGEEEGEVPQEPEFGPPIDTTPVEEPPEVEDFRVRGRYPISFGKKAKPTEAMLATMNAGRSFLLSAPTGSGKSPFFQYVAALSDKFFMLLSPKRIISEMHQDDFRQLAQIPGFVAFRGDPGALDPDPNVMDPEKYASEREAYSTQRNDVISTLLGGRRTTTGWQFDTTLPGPKVVGRSYEGGAGPKGMLGEAIAAYAEKGQFGGIMIDEGHNIMDPSRPMIRAAIDFYRQIAPNTQVAIVSATMTKWQANNLAEWAGIDSEDMFQIAKEKDPRKKGKLYSIPGIRFENKGKDMDKLIGDAVEEYGHSMVFMTSVDEVNRTVLALNERAGEIVALPYHGASGERALTPEQKAEAEAQLGSSSPSKTIVSTNIAGEGIHPKGYRSIIDTTRSSMQQLEQHAGRLTLPEAEGDTTEGHITMIQDPEDYAKNAAKMDLAISHFSDILDPAYAEIRGKAVRGEYSRNWQVAYSQMEQIVENHLTGFRSQDAPRGLYKHAAGLVMNLFMNEDMIDMVRMQDEEGGEEYVNWAVKNQPGRHAKDLRRKSILRPGTTVDYAGTEREYKWFAENTSGGGKLLERMVGVSPGEAYRRHESAAEHVMNWRAEAPRLPGYEDLSATLDNGARIENPEFTGPGFAEIEGGRAALFMLREQINGASAISKTTQTSPAGARGADRSAISSADRSLPGTVEVQEDGRQPEVLQRPSRLLANLPDAPGTSFPPPIDVTANTYAGSNDEFATAKQAFIDAMSAEVELIKQHTGAVGDNLKATVDLTKFSKDRARDLNNPALLIETQRAVQDKFAAGGPDKDYWGAISSGVMEAGIEYGTASVAAGGGTYGGGRTQLSAEHKRLKQAYPKGYNYLRTEASQGGQEELDAFYETDPTEQAVKKATKLAEAERPTRPKIGGVLYGLFQERRVIQATFAQAEQQALQSPDLWAPVAFGGADGNYMASMSGQRARYVEGQTFLSQAAQQQMGALVDIPYAMSGFKWGENVARAGTTAAIGSAIAGMGMAAAMSLTFMGPVGAGAALPVAATGIGLGAAVAIGGGVAEWFNYSQNLQGEDKLTISNMARAVARNYDIKQKYGEVTPETQALYKKDLEGYKETNPQFYNFLTATGEKTEKEKKYEELANRIISKGGGNLSLEQVSAGLPDFMRLVPDDKKLEERALSFYQKGAELGYAPQQWTSMAGQIASMRGYLPQSKESAALIEQVSDMQPAEFERFQGAAQVQSQYTSQIAQYTGGYYNAAQITQRYNIDDPFKARLLTQQYEAWGQRGLDLKATAFTLPGTPDTYRTANVFKEAEGVSTQATPLATQRYIPSSQGNVVTEPEIPPQDKIWSLAKFAAKTFGPAGWGFTQDVQAAKKELYSSENPILNAIFSKADTKPGGVIPALDKGVETFTTGSVERNPDWQKELTGLDRFTTGTIEKNPNWLKEFQDKAWKLVAPLFGEKTEVPPARLPLIMPRDWIQGKLDSGDVVGFLTGATTAKAAGPEEERYDKGELDNVPVTPSRSRAGSRFERRGGAGGRVGPEGFYTETIPGEEPRAISFGEVIAANNAALAEKYGAQQAYAVSGLATGLATTLADTGKSTLMGGIANQNIFANYFASKGYTAQQADLTGKILGGDLGAASYASYKEPDLLRNIGQTVEGNRAYNMSGQPIYQTSMQDFMKWGFANVGTNAAAQKYFGGEAAQGWEAFQDTAAGVKADMIGQAMAKVPEKGPANAIAGWSAGALAKGTEQYNQWYQQASQEPFAAAFTGWMGWDQKKLTSAQQQAVTMFQDPTKGIEDLSNKFYARQGEINLQLQGIQQQQFQGQVQYIQQMRPLEDQMRQMGYQSQMANFSAQRERMELGNQFSIRQEGISGERMKVQQQYQLWSANFEYQGSLQQREWTKQDWQYQDQSRNMQFGWGMEDINEGIRRSSGYERKQLIKQRGRMVTTQGMEEGQIETQRERQGEVWAREDERYQKQTEYIKKLMGLDQEQFQLNIEQRKEFYELDMKNLQRHISEYQKSYELQTKIQQIERDYQDKNLEYQRQQMELQKESYDMQRTLEEVTRKANQAFSGVTGEMEMIAKYGANVVNVLKALGEATKVMGNTPLPNINATKGVFDSMNKLTVQLANAIREIIEAAASGAP